MRLRRNSSLRMAMDTRAPIVLIDDDRAWRETLADYLSEKGFQVHTAEGGTHGLKLLEEYDVPLALVDYHMPGMDGLELLRHLRRQQRKVAVLLFSSDDDPSLQARALA